MKSELDRAAQRASTTGFEERGVVLISYSTCLVLSIPFLFNTTAQPRKSLGLSCMWKWICRSQPSFCSWVDHNLTQIGLVDTEKQAAVSQKSGQKRDLAQGPQNMLGSSLYLTEFSPQIQCSKSPVSSSERPWVVHKDEREKNTPAGQSEVFQLDQMWAGEEFPTEEKPTERGTFTCRLFTSRKP